MNVQLNIKSAAQRLMQFVQLHGGSAKHSEILECVSNMCGFESYRSMKAISETAMKKPSGATTELTEAEIEVVGRLLERPEHVVYRSSAVDWQLSGNPDISMVDLPASHRQKYDVIVESFGCQFRILMKPEGTTLDNFDGKPVLDVLLEINQGVPCAHITNDPADAMLLTVFANAQGVIVRPDDGEWLSEFHARVPEGLRKATQLHCGQEQFNQESFVVVMDTQQKYAEEAPAIVPVPRANENRESTLAMLPSDNGQDTSVLLPYPYVQVFAPQGVIMPYMVDRIRISFQKSSYALSSCLHLEISLETGMGVTVDSIGCVSSFDTSSDRTDVRMFATNMSRVVAYFVSKRKSMKELNGIICRTAQSASRMQIAKDCVNIIMELNDVTKAFSEIDKLTRSST
ncbi:MAG: hypothetical protein Q7U16_12720 [Agitococcus sp.]|nr:hypothetical protein [Agitococcus sp.]